MSSKTATKALGKHYEACAEAFESDTEATHISLAEDDRVKSSKGKSMTVSEDLIEGAIDTVSTIVKKMAEKSDNQYELVKEASVIAARCEEAAKSQEEIAKLRTDLALAKEQLRTMTLDRDRFKSELGEAKARIAAMEKGCVMM